LGFFYRLCWGRGLTYVLQAADFADRAASGALTAVVSAEVERLRTQHADAVREKSAADSKCRKLADKVAALEGEKTDLRRQLVEERREANEALAKAQVALAEANLARAEGSLARERAEQLQERLNALQSRVERTEAATRAEAERTRKQLMDSYHELGAWTGDFEVPDREPGHRCLEWVQEELQALPTIVEGFMSYASLVTCEGAMNALSREGCRHFEVFDQADKDFERDIYKVEDPIVKESAGAIYDRMWGLHGREVVRERAETARAQVTFGFCLTFAGCGLCVGLLNLCGVC
jgi:small-conductance mechanosensitive channel